MSQEGQKINPFKGVEVITNAIHKAKNLKLKRQQFNHKQMQDRIRNEIDRKRLELGYKKIDLGHKKINSSIAIQNTKRDMGESKNRTTRIVSENNKEGNLAKASAVKYAADRKNEMNKRDNYQRQLDRQAKAKGSVDRATKMAKQTVSHYKDNMSWANNK